MQERRHPRVTMSFDKQIYQELMAHAQEHDGSLTREVLRRLRASLWPCNEGRAPVGNVIILNAEDGADDTIVPRLIAAGADLKRVHIVSAVMQEDGKGRRSFNLQADLALLEKKIAEIGDVALVIIDPISSYMGKTDSHKNAEVRSALEPASEMAERMKVAILSITHFSKTGAGNNGKALHRFIGSIAFVGAPRAAFAVIQDTDNEGRMLLLQWKTALRGEQSGSHENLSNSLHLSWRERALFPNLKALVPRPAFGPPLFHHALAPMDGSGIETI